MKKKIFYILFLSLICFCCRKNETLTDTSAAHQETIRPSLITYIIKKGNHYAEQNQLQVMDTAAISARVTFNNSAMYKTTDPLNQGDVNKLLGFSDCGTHHQQNSARLGWSWSGSELILYAYAYVDSIRVIKTLGAVQLNETISCSVKAANNYYYFKAKNYTDSIPRHCNGYKGQAYKLYPYFGGDEVAPHDVSISILEE